MNIDSSRISHRSTKTDYRLNLWIVFWLIKSFDWVNWLFFLLWRWSLDSGADLLILGQVSWFWRWSLDSGGDLFFQLIFSKNFLPFSFPLESKSRRISWIFKHFFVFKLAMEILWCTASIKAKNIPGWCVDRFNYPTRRFGGYRSFYLRILPVICNVARRGPRLSS